MNTYISKRAGGERERRGDILVLKDSNISMDWPSVSNDWKVWIIVIFIIFLLIWVYVKVSDPTLTDEVYVPRVQTVPIDADELIEVCVLRTPVISTLLTQEQAEEEDAVEEKEILATKPLKQSIGEAECYRVFCELFGEEEVRVQSRNIPWLVNPLTKRHLELDIYVPKHGIACEYNGQQHYRVVRRFHKYGQQSLDYQIWKDNVKVNLCDANGVYLITVPYWEKKHNIRQFILDSMPK